MQIVLNNGMRITITKNAAPELVWEFNKLLEGSELIASIK